VKWTLRGLLLIGIGTSAFTLVPLVSVGLSVALAAAEQLLERAVFLYTSMYIQAMPDFKYDPEKWSHMAFLLAQRPEDPNVVGFVFTDAEYAVSIFKMIRAWNHGEDEDRDNNIRLTFVIDEDHYWVYVYGSLRKRSIVKFQSMMKRRARSDKAGKEHLGLVAMPILCKSFSTGEGFGVGAFIDSWRKGTLFLMHAMLQKEGRGLIFMPEIRPIRKWHMKAKAACEMSSEDDEYDHWRRGPMIAVAPLSPIDPDR